MDLSKVIEENQDLLQLHLFVREHLRNALWNVLHNTSCDPLYEGLPNDPEELYNELHTLILQPRRKPPLFPDQLKLIFPANKQTDSKTFDVTLLCRLIDILNIPLPLKQFVERAKALRNFLAHRNVKFLSETEVERIWGECANVVLGLGYQFNIETFKNASLDPVRAPIIVSILEILDYMQNEFKTEIINVKEVRERIKHGSVETLNNEIKVQQIEFMKSDLNTALKRLEIPGEASQNNFDDFGNLIKKDLPKLEESCHHSTAECFSNAIHNSSGLEKKISRLGGNVLFIRDDAFKIGGTSASKVYVGYHRENGWVAVKRCPKGKCSKNEIEFLKNYATFPYPHMNVISFVRSYEERNKKFNIVMELCENTLKDRITKSQNLMCKVKMIFDFLSGLECLHKVGAVHRDLKPENLLINLHGVLKISDFGITRIVPDDQTYKTCVGGTRFWVPPPFIGKLDSDILGKVKKEHDIFVALMIIFFILTDGDHPFRKAGQDGYVEYQKNVENIENRKTCLDNSKLPEIPDNPKCLPNWFITMFDKWFSDQKSVSIPFIVEELRNVLDVNQGTPGIRHAILLSNTITLFKKETISNISNQLNELGLGGEAAVNDMTVKVGNLLDDNRVGPDEFVNNILECIGRVHEFTIEFNMLKMLCEELLRKFKFQLTTPQIDVAFMKRSLERNKFNVNAQDDISKNQLFEIFKSIKDKEANKNDDIYIFLHVSGHGCYDVDAEDTFIKMNNGENGIEWVAVKAIFDELFSECTQKFKLIFTAEVCREERNGVGLSVDMPEQSIIAIYSQNKGFSSADIGFVIPSYLSSFLSEAIKPGKTLKEVIQTVCFRLKQFDPNWPQPDVEKKDDSLLDFVF